MKEILDQFVQFLQQGIAAIFRFVQLIWTWSLDQITKVMQVPWENWPLWKQILLVVVIVAVAYAFCSSPRGRSGWRACASWRPLPACSPPWWSRSR